MDKGKVFTVYAVGQGADKIKFLVIGVEQGDIRAETGNGHNVHSQLFEQLTQKALVPPPEIPEQMLVTLPAVVKNRMPSVAVAPQGMDIAPFGQLHDIPQGFKTLVPLFQKVAVDNELILRREGCQLQDALEIFQVPVNIGYDKYSAATVKVQPLYAGRRVIHAHDLPASFPSAAACRCCPAPDPVP